MFFITCFTKIPTEDDFTNIGSTRTFGYLESFEDAEKALNENWCDMFECYYDYAVVEEIGPGIHCYAGKDERTFFKWDRNKNGFFKIDPIPEFKHIGNIAIG